MLYIQVFSEAMAKLTLICQAGGSAYASPIPFPQATIPTPPCTCFSVSLYTFRLNIAGAGLVSLNGTGCREQVLWWTILGARSSSQPTVSLGSSLTSMQTTTWVSTGGSSQASIKEPLSKSRLATPLT